MDAGAAPAPPTVSSDAVRCLWGIHLQDGGKRGNLWRRRARDSSPPNESTLLSQPLHVYGLSASCLWCGCVEAGDKYGRSLLASNMYGLTPSRKGVFARSAGTPLHIQLYAEIYAMFFNSLLASST